MNSLFEYLETKEISRNKSDTKITWYAKYKDSGDELVIKQIICSKENYVLSGVEAYKKKIQYFQAKNHPSIIRYLGVFSTSDSFFILRDYKKGVIPLSKLDKIRLEEIKSIAIKILSVLKEFQESSPPMIHQNIKPENIFIDNKLNIYLTDFGFSEVSTQSMYDFSVDNIFEGTPGFIAPEQFIRPTKASDMYGLGATLICLITKTKSENLSLLLDKKNKYKINFEHLTKGLRPDFVRWLEKMVATDQRERFRTAGEALEALLPIYVVRYPEVKLSVKSLEIKINQLGEKETVTIEVSNPIDNTLLRGKWVLARNINDGYDRGQIHGWLSILPNKFANNHVFCTLKVSSEKLMADQIYERYLVLKNNSRCEKIKIPLKIITPPLSLNIKKPPYFYIASIFLSSVIISIFGGISGILAGNIGGLVGSLAAWFFAGIIASFALTSTYMSNDTWSNSRLSGGIIGSFLLWGMGLTLVLLALRRFGSPDLSKIAIAQFIVLITAGVLAIFSHLVLEKFKEIGFSKLISFACILSSIISGILLGIQILLGFKNIYIFIPFMMSNIVFFSVLFYPLWKELKLINEYKKAAKENQLIKP
ncbi:protein kinase domain-containing protein [Geminocystis sp. NIES-3709]|uniref:protein kinase domain-containing protein n=1 Tax=Geminocystis sp. NIES-3709 TaxID=1617448 RepID=UPI0005FCBF75|nr:protein kinase [Geminocystis sp. NIES-3709]BAQ65397.1 serine/threonine kinase [Geminocystis sp. NIES-3709]